MEKIVIVGNGFDLYHKLETSFNDFVNLYKGDEQFKEILNNLKNIGYENHLDSNSDIFSDSKDWNNIEEYLGCMRSDSRYKKVKSVFSTSFRRYI